MNTNDPRVQTQEWQEKVIEIVEEQNEVLVEYVANMNKRIRKIEDRISRLESWHGDVGK